MAERAVAGSPLGRIAGTEAKSHGWERLSEGYAETLGIPTSGWPEESR